MRTCHLTMLMALLVTACTQQAAKVELRGSQTFARGEVPRLTASSASHAVPSTITVAPTRPIDQSTSQSVKVESVTSSDLPPPSKVQLQHTAEPLPQKISQATPAPAPQKKVATAKKSEGFIWPVEGGKVISAFGPKGKGRANDGVNIAAAAGEPVYASADGEVVYVGDKVKGYGNMVLLKHEGNRHTTYAHLNRAGVARYDRVKQGDIIGYVGSTGNVKQPQLYFAMREGTKAVDPNRYLSSSYAGLR